MTLKSLLLLSVLGLTACGGTIDRKDMLGIVPELTFAQLEPLPLNINAIETDIVVKPVTQDQPIAHTPLDQSFANYVAQRFVRLGGAGSGTFTVKLDDHNVTRDVITPENSPVAWTRLDQVSRYNASIKVTLMHAQDVSGITKRVTIVQEGSMDIPQRVSIAERERMEQQFIERLIATLDQKIIKELNERLLIL